MKMLVFYRPNSEHARVVEDYIRDLEIQHGVGTESVEMIDIDTRDGAAMASIYDVVAYPGIAVVDTSGAFVNMWSGELPLQNELMGYLWAN